MEKIMTLRQHRMAQGMTIRDLAQAAQISTQTVVSIEKGRPARIKSFRRIAEAIGVEMMEIREYRTIAMRE